MRKSMICVWMTLGLFVVTELAAQDQRVIRDVVLLDREPYEVLMTGHGDILSKIAHLPNYLQSREEIKTQITSNEPIASLEVSAPEAESVVIVDTVDPAPEVQVVSPVKKSEPFRDYYEIEFVQGTATLSSKSIASLNALAKMLNENPEQKVQVFGFQNESPIIALLLSKRRRDACIAYLKIKGVRVDRQISKGSITEGSYNKIVFGLE